MRHSSMLALAVVIGAAACVPTVQTDFDPEVAFSSLRSYGWTDSAPSRRRELEEAAPFLERRLRRAVDLVLEERGYRAAPPSAQPDFLISAFVVGPTHRESPWRLWASTRCVGAPHVTVGFGYPYGFSRRFPWYRYRDFYRWDPWGYACSYRLGFGYVWLPIYDQPGDRMPGTVVIDMMDPVSKELIWRGWAEGALLGRAATRSQEEIDEIVARILDRFPPGRPR